MTVPLPSVPFYFLRHGVTDHNQRRLVMGQLDIPLNDFGRWQARRAAAVLEDSGITLVASSPLARARETAEIIAGALGLSVTVIDGLKERDWGEMSGRTYRELMAITANPAGAETIGEFSDRIVAALAGMPLTKPVLFVSHSGMCRVLRYHMSLLNDRRRVPNATPILFSPDSSGQWSERIMGARAESPREDNP